MRSILWSEPGSSLSSRRDRAHMSPPLCKLQDKTRRYSTHSFQQHDVILLFISLHHRNWIPTSIPYWKPLLCLNHPFVNSDSGNSRDQEKLTCQSWSHKGVLMRGVTHPLLAALPWDLHSAGHRAVTAGEPDVHSTEGHAPYGAVQTRALVFTTALEGLSAAVHHPAEHASGTISCCGTEIEGGYNSNSTTID